MIPQQLKLYLITPIVFILLFFFLIPTALADGPLPFSEDFASFSGAGFQPTPSAGQLDSDIWIATGLSDGSMSFGDTETGGDFARGTSGGGVESGGIYAFDTGSNPILGVQPSGSDFTPGEFILRLKNTTGSPVAQLNVAYDIWVYNDQPRGNSLNFSYSTDGTNYTAISALDYTSPADADISPIWRSAARNTLIAGLSVPANGYIYLKWTGDDVTGSGNRDEMGIDDVNVTIPTDNAYLALSKVATPTLNAPYHGLVTYTVSLANVGMLDESNALFTDTLPAEVDFHHWLISPTNTSLINDEITWNGPLSATEAVTFTFVVTHVGAYNDQVENTALFSGTVNAGSASAGFTVQGDTGLCGQTVTPIYAIQGSGFTSPFDGQTLTTEGVVTADFQESNELNGFYLQDPVGDGDPATSDGIFVYDPGGTAVSEGDIVAVSGTVAEYLEQTEIGSVSQIIICGTGSVSPTDLSLPVANTLEFESREGMLVSLLDEMTASQNYFQGRYGQVTLSAQGRLIKPTNIFRPLSPQALALADENLRRMLILDDGSTSQNPNPIPYIGLDNTLRAGDSAANLQGIIDYGPINSNSALRHYRLQPTGVVTFSRSNQRTASPPAVGGNLKVASFNVLNYFNGDGLGSGFPTSRGADTLQEFQRQRAKIITAVIALNADVIGLMEIENDGYGVNSAIQDLVNGLNAQAGSGAYAFVDPGVAQIGTDEIAVGLIYRTANVNLVGSAAILDSSFDPDYNDNKNRPALAQTFASVSSGETLTVVVNHLKSKGSDCDDVGDPDTGDGQGNCNLTRTKAMSVEVAWLNTDPTSSGDPDFLIIGDLNAYGREDPIVAAESAGYVSLPRQLDANNAYSFVFDGEMGYLDHALASPSLATQVNNVTFWHINADEPAVIDYNTEFKPQDLYAPHAYRASDHDPVLVGLNLGAQTATLTLNKTVQTISGQISNLPVGEVLTYTITIANPGDDTAFGVVISDILPAGLSFEGFVAQGSAQFVITDTIIWGPYDVTGGLNYSILFTATVNGDVQGQTITNTAYFQSLNGGSGSAAITVSVQSAPPITNAAPIAADDAYTGTANLPLSVSIPGVLINDTDADGDPLTATLNTLPLSGSLNLLPDGSFVYTPTADFVGGDYFTYYATDAISPSNIATVSLNIVASSQSYSLLLSAPIYSQSGAPGATLTYTIYVSNTGSVSDTFNLSTPYSGSNNLPVILGPVMAGSAISYNLQIGLPAAASDGEMFVTPVTAVSMGNSAISDTITLTTTATVAQWRLYLPLLLK